MPFIVFVLASVGCAVPVLSWMRLPRTGESVAYHFLVGACVLATLTIVAGSVSLLAARVIAGAAAVAGLYRFMSWRESSPSDDPSTASPLERISLAACFIAVAFGVVLGMAPGTAWDAGVAHLALPAAYLREGRIHLVEGNNYSAYPHLIQSLSALVYAPRDETRAAWICAFFGILSCVTVYHLARRMAGREAGAIAAALLSTTPIFMDQASSPTIDLAYTATLLGALNALVAWRNDNESRWLVIAAILAGSGCGVRHTAYLAGLLMTAGVFYFARERRAGTTGLFLAAAAVSASPWLLRSAMVAGNPFYPFLSSYFPSAIPDVDVARVGTHSSIQGMSVIGFVLFPWELVMNPVKYGGWHNSPGTLWLLLGIPGLFAGGRTARGLGAFSGAGIASLYFFQRFARYALPFIAPMMAVAAVGACRIGAMRKPVAALLVATYAFGLIPAVATLGIKWSAITGVETREQFLARRVERYPAMAWANENLDASETILTLDPRGYYFDAPTFSNFEALKPLTRLRKSEQLEWLRERRVRYLFYPEAYVLESPAFRETGVLEMLNAWRADTGHFRLVHRMILDRPRGGGREIVEIYEFH